ncbi:hypothetical protein Mapa_004242 [Marchantia paleacea]|nr:hypothetical protein Mapa_004242 [Marchantia paleacea]
MAVCLPRCSIAPVAGICSAVTTCVPSHAVPGLAFACSGHYSFLTACFLASHYSLVLTKESTALIHVAVFHKSHHSAAQPILSGKGHSLVT